MGRCLSYRIVEEPLMYIVYIIMVSIISITIIVFSSNLSAGLVNMVMGVISNNYGSEINLIGTFPKGNTVCVPVSFPGMIKIPEMGIIQTYNQRMLYIKIKFLNEEKVYYQPIVPVVGVIVNKSLNEAYAPFLIKRSDVGDRELYTWYSADNGKYYYRFIEGGNGLQLDDYYLIQYKIPFDKKEIEERHSVCFVVYDGVIVPKSLLDS